MNLIPVPFQQGFRNLLWSLAFSSVEPYEEVAKMGNPAPHGVPGVTPGIKAAQVGKRESPGSSLPDRHNILDVLRLQPAPIDGF
jgi:hypothetical protein